MKTLLAAAVLVMSFWDAWSATTIDPVNSEAYGANVGWVDWSGDSTNGAVIGAYVCSGYIYSANVGWVSLGNGIPTNGIYYQNTSLNDFGVNQDGLGNFRGYAYGANIGWINFENTGAPRIDLVTGRLNGYAWSANCGWISLSNAVAYVQTDQISPGTLDTNGFAVAWELTYFGRTGVDPNADADNDGMSNYEEYIAGTSPVNGSDYLAITSESLSPGGTNVTLAWNSVPSRSYYVQKALGLNPPNWTDSGIGLIAPGGSSTAVNFSDTNASAKFYRVEAVRPLFH